MTSIGVSWPDQETDDEEEEDSEEEYGGDEDSEEESETESEEVEDALEVSGPKGSGLEEVAGDSALLGKMPTKEESGSGTGVGSHVVCACVMCMFLVNGAVAKNGVRILRVLIGVTSSYAC